MDLLQENATIPGLSGELKERPGGGKCTFAPCPGRPVSTTPGPTSRTASPTQPLPALLDFPLSHQSVLEVLS